MQFEPSDELSMAEGATEASCSLFWQSGDCKYFIDKKHGGDVRE